MIDFFIPTSAKVSALANVVGYVTEGLDAVVIDHREDIVRQGTHIKVAGNSRDLGIVAERVKSIGGEVD